MSPAAEGTERAEAAGMMWKLSYTPPTYSMSLDQFIEAFCTCESRPDRVVGQDMLTPGTRAFDSHFRGHGKDYLSGWLNTLCPEMFPVDMVPWVTEIPNTEQTLFRDLVKEYEGNLEGDAACVASWAKKEPFVRSCKGAAVMPLSVAFFLSQFRTHF